jgi:hypothetical protein
MRWLFRTDHPFPRGQATEALVFQTRKFQLSLPCVAEMAALRLFFVALFFLLLNYVHSDSSKRFLDTCFDQRTLHNSLFSMVPHPALLEIGVAATV